ncbi:MAG: NfeD family protein [Chloroflexota bacterium]
MWCHILLFAPAFGLALFALLPLPLALPLYAVVAIGSLGLYVAVWKSLCAPVATGPEAMIGATATVMEDIASEGLIRYRGELWMAIADQPIRCGEVVRIVGFEGLRVMIERLEGGEHDGEGPGLRHGGG